MITENCLVGCFNDKHHDKCEMHQFNNYIPKDNRSLITCCESYSNLLTSFKKYEIILEQQFSFTVMCDNGKIKEMSKRLFINYEK